MENFESRERMESYLAEIERKLQETNPIAEYCSKKYEEIKEKLPEDMKSLATQYLMLFGLILEEAEKNAAFAERMLLPYKNWDRLYKYMDNLARPTSKKEKSYRPRCAMIDSFTLLGWIRDYYFLDDKDEYEKEVAEETAAAKKREEAAAKISNKYKKKETDTSVENVSKVTIPVKKKTGRDVDGQIDFFSMLAN